MLCLFNKLIPCTIVAVLIKYRGPNSCECAPQIPLENLNSGPETLYYSLKVALPGEGKGKENGKKGKRKGCEWGEK